MHRRLRRELTILPRVCGPRTGRAGPRAPSQTWLLSPGRVRSGAELRPAGLRTETGGLAH